VTQQETVSESLIQSVVRVLFRMVFVFEPLAPTAITYYVNQRLNLYKKSHAISDYKTKTKRLGKFHYKVEIDLDLTGMQAIHLLGNLFPSQFKRFRRWFHD
jgi:hypothetical protein